MTEMKNGVAAPGRARIGTRTLRTDNWRFAPVLTFSLLTLWVLYAVWRTASQTAYFAPEEHYLSPFTSPCVSASCPPGARDFGTWFGEMPPFIPLAIISLVFLLGFRLTCYYYRRAYYRSFWASPPACAVAEPHKAYSGETRFPLILQNIHRWFWYAAVLVALILSYDTVLAFRDEHEEWGHMGLGTVLMVINIVLIWLYTLSCHSCRHITGGRLRHFSKHPIRYRMWTFVSRLNTRHGQYAWYSLFSVALVDLYIYLLATGAFDDPRFF
jgi:hypothetical protein